MAVSHAVRRGLAEAVLQRWRRVRDPADVPSGQGAPPAAAPPPPPQFQFAPISLPDGMTAPLAVPLGGVPHGLFGLFVRLVHLTSHRGVLSENVCVCKECVKGTSCECAV